ncbi:hypothetical protein CPC08DRAFT_651937 [Agrocybe pediades]|nr:hypothetical protein CPC08DRAFT_651937 [Agrocybe pediades]
MLPFVLWAERVTIQRSTGYSPYYIAHGVDPLFPFDIYESTFMDPDQYEVKTTQELITQRAVLLQKRPEELDRVAEMVHTSRVKQAEYFKQANEDKLRMKDFDQGDLVLLRNSPTENSLDKKTKPRYIGPYIIIRKTKEGSYICAEMDRTVSLKHFAAFRLRDYHPRQKITIPDNLLSLTKAEIDQLAYGIEEAVYDEQL